MLFYTIAAMDLFDVIIKPSLQFDSGLEVDTIPDLPEMTMCMWLHFPTALNGNSSQLIYLAAYAVNPSSQLTADSFYLALNGNKKLVFGIGAGASTW